MRMAGCIYYLRKRAPGCTVLKRQRQFDTLGNILLGNLRSWHLCRCYFDILLTYCHRPSTPLHDNGVCVWQRLVSCHTANMVQYFLRSMRESTRTSGSANFPELKPVKYLWNMLDKPGGITSQCKGLKGSAADFHARTDLSCFLSNRKTNIKDIVCFYCCDESTE